MIYKLCERWIKVEEFLGNPAAGLLTERGRLLIYSDGSLTRLLEALYLKDIYIELKNQSIGKLYGNDADYPGISEDEEIIEREVWLIEGNTKLVYARSIIPLKVLPSGILDRLKPGKEPLGSILEESLFCKKTSWEIGRVQWVEIAGEFSLPDNHIFWTRRYQIVSQEGLMAVVMEVFSPILVE